MNTPMIRLLRLLAPSGGRVMVAVLLGAAAVGSGVALLATSAYLISMAAIVTTIAALQIAIVAVRFFGIARGVFRYLERYVSHTVTLHLLARIRVWFYQALEPLAPARLASFRSGDLVSRAVSDVDELQDFYVRAVAPPLVALVVAVAAGGVLYRYDPRFAGVFWLTMFLAGVGIPFLTWTLSRRPGSERVALRSGLRASLVDGVQGMADLLASGGDQQFERRVARETQALARTERRLAWVEGLEEGLLPLLSHLGALGVLTLAIVGVSAGRIQGVMVAALTLLALASFEVIQPLPSAARRLGESLAAARRLFELVDADPAVVEPARPALPPTSFDLRVENLSFRYGPAEPWALREVGFELPHGSRLAVVGPSGAGKSTLVHLLLRFWEYDRGEMRLGEDDLRRYRPDDVRSAMGVVDQDTYLFNATARENLLIARPEAGPDEVVQAARAARIHEFIRSLPEGYDTRFGERGVRLSGGQRQRLALARALLADTPILLLDEPTAHLDALTEKEVLGEILAGSAGRSLILVTHRLAGLEAMDEILILQEGRVVARGRHVALVRQEGWYRRMWALQRQVLPA